MALHFTRTLRPAFLLLTGWLLWGNAAAAPLSMAGNPPLASATYQLGQCQAPAEWQVLIGRCPSGGAYSGQGALRRNGMVFLGPIKDGLPHGKGSLCMVMLSQYRDGENIDCGNGQVSCEATFDAGKIADQTLRCDLTPRRSGYYDNEKLPLQVVLRSSSGFSFDDGLAGAQNYLGRRFSTLIADLVEVEIKGAMVYNPIPAGFQRGPSTATGTARQVRISSEEFHLSRLQGTLSVQPILAGKSPSALAKIPKDPLVVKGSFDVKLDTVSRFVPAGYARLPDGSFPQESLTTISYQGKTHQVVYFPVERASEQVRYTDVAYFKDEAGVEFDGTGPECPALKLRGLARLSAVSFTANNGFTGEFSLSPQCGTIKTPTGSYTGRFEDGRPVN